jgi:hypothetical protein
MDMVGAGLESKSVFHVSGGPGHLPSFVYDIGQAFGAWVNEQTYQYAATGTSQYPLVSAKGGKEPLLAALDEYDMGSDHDVYQDASWGIPALYLHDWPDRYIHTTWDTPERIDPTKLLRAAFIGAASGYFLASMSPNDSVEVKRAIKAGSLRRWMRVNERSAGLERNEAEHLARYYRYYDAAASGFWGHPAPYDTSMIVTPVKASGDAGRVFTRNPGVRGPMSVFGYDYLRGKLGEARVDKLGLLKYNGLRGAGGDYAYEVLNLARYPLRAIDIRNTVSAIYGPVPTSLVLEYILALKDAGIVRVH